MAKGRSLSLDVPKYLLDQIQQRACVNARKRNAELRYLVDLGLRYAGVDDVILEIPKDVEWVKTTIRLNPETFQLIVERSREFHRGMGIEVVRMVGYAIEETARRDLELIAEMMSRQAPVSRSSPQTGET